MDFSALNYTTGTCVWQPNGQGPITKHINVVCDGMERGLRCSHFTQQRVMDVGGNCDVMSGQENPLTCLVSSLNRPNCGSPEMMYLKILRPEFLLTIITQHTYTALI